MKVRNGEIRAENVLVEGGIKLAFVDWWSSEGHPTIITAITAVFPKFASTLVAEL